MDRLRKLILEALNKPTKTSCSCGCNSCGNKAPILNESKQYEYPISIHMRHHLDNKIPLHDTKFIVGSNKYINFIKEAKLLAKKGIIKLNEEDEKFVNGGEKWQVVWYDYDHNETIDDKTFNTKQEADQYAEGLVYDYQDIIINDEGHDEWKTFYRYYNEKDKTNPHYGYTVEKVENIKENSPEKMGDKLDRDFSTDVLMLPYQDLLNKVIEDLGEGNDLYQDLLADIFDKNADGIIDTLKFYNVYDNYKHLLNLNENSSQKLYKLEGLLITNTNIRSQQEILSDIRSLPGITIVNNKEKTPSSPKPGYVYTYTVIKVDPYVYLKDKEFNIRTIEQIIQNIKDVKGVVIYKAEPKLINVGI